MPLTLVTGLPGHGKTLRAIFMVERERREPPAGSKEAPRAVYYDGIQSLTLDWTQLPEPELVAVVADNVTPLRRPRDVEWKPGHFWYQVPDGALVVIDEAQRIFRPRGIGSVVPEYVARLETHRHHGLDLVLITQHPKLLDVNVRKLIDRHVHVKRAFGAGISTLYTWTEVQEDPSQGRENAQTETWRHPPEVFGYYKSAEVHTVKRRLPWRLVSLPLLLVGVIGLGLWGWRSFVHRNDTAAAAAAGSPTANHDGAARPAGERDARRTAAQYVADYQPRLPGLAYTAPAYDKVTQPKVAPVPAACIASAHSCQCYSQQATALDVSEPVCRQIVSKGWFDDFEVRAAGRDAQAPRPASPMLSDLDRAMALRQVPEAAPAAPGAGSDLDVLLRTVKTKAGRVVSVPAGATP